VEGFLVEFSVPTGAEAEFSSGEVFSVRTYWTFPDAEVQTEFFKVGGLSPGLIAGEGAARGAEVRRAAFGILALSDVCMESIGEL